MQKPTCKQLIIKAIISALSADTLAERLLRLLLTMIKIIIIVSADTLAERLLRPESAYSSRCTLKGQLTP